MPFHAEPADAVARWASVTLSCLLEEQHSSAALGAFIESLPATELFRAEAPPPPPRAKGPARGHVTCSRTCIRTCIRIRTCFRTRTLTQPHIRTLT